MRLIIFAMDVLIIVLAVGLVVKFYGAGLKRGMKEGKKYGRKRKTKN